ncbi:LabA-like NYN domain-containing protein [Pseudothauera rhizosphaerae]|uniref:NYN domain-containing protein n=1 Tax=Pseudothauera rhizosphaerae TaxID=2565932 RepID=A0A4S4AFU6_9RHOO|nr:NYN domain-containing protein [Pseudothauera rhizosphaerae]THF57617.1 NYN domain-containing protein [Pseudothauera rhizosphaerae]
MCNRTGVFIDFANIGMNGGYGLRLDILRRFAARDGGELVRLNAYLPFDAARADTDSAYRSGQQRFYDALRDNGFKVFRKPVRWYDDGEGRRYSKADCDMDIALDILQQAPRLDTVLLASGDSDFVRVVETAQSMGCRVEGLAFRNVSRALRNALDSFTSGYLVPHLVSTERKRNGRDGNDWGVAGGFARGVCYHFENGYGFVRFLRKAAGPLWLTDSRDTASPWATCFLHASQLPATLATEALPSRDLVLEFDLEEGETTSKLRKC